MNTPTPEQHAIIDAARTGENIVITAGAGCGKTTVLRMIAEALGGRGLYLAYNRVTALEAKRSFPRRTQCMTAHALAYGKIVRGTPREKRLKAGRMPPSEQARILTIIGPTRLSDEFVAAPWQLMRLVNDTVRRFCYSDDPTISERHVPVTPGLDDPETHGFVRSVVTPLAVRAWGDLSMETGRLPLSHDHYLKCQPSGTLVRVVGRPGGNNRHVRESWSTEWREIPIEEIRIGDRVVSWGGAWLGYIRKTGHPVTSVGRRYYRGNLITVSTPSGATSSYTHDHICIAHIADAMDGKTVVYLMRKGLNYRIGRAMWRYGSQGNTLGLATRIRAQEPDAVWILSAHDSDRDASLAEALTAYQYGIPTWQFQSLNEAMPLDEFWAKVGDNSDRAARCLRHHGRDALYPFWERAVSGALLMHKTRVPVLIRACNLMDGMRVCEVDQASPSSNGFITTGGWTRAWQCIEVKVDPYDGLVHSIEVEVDHTYIADGIVTHNCWTLTKPQANVDYILFDEAQDSNNCTSGIILSQRDTQTLVVGDENQQLYQWRGSVNALKKWPAQHRLQLSRSWRFGQPIADEANRWLTLLRSELRLTGNPAMTSRLDTLLYPDAVLCRANAAGMAEALEALEAGRRPALVGGGDDLHRLAEACLQLKQRGSTTHPDLFAFTSWLDVQSYVEQDAAGGDLKVAVRLIDQYGPEELISALDRLVPEASADVVISTAHKSKGRQFTQVRIGPDFYPLKKKDDDSPEEPSRAEMMLAYVATTRAREVLDRGSLSWIDEYEENRN